jgi:hypothetical protein
MCLIDYHPLIIFLASSIQLAFGGWLIGSNLATQTWLHSFIRHLVVDWFKLSHAD